MTPREVIAIIAALSVIIVIAQWFSDRHTIRTWGAKSYAHGWADGWDARDADWYPETPEPQGRHHGLSQPEDWTATDILEFTLPAPPLPKRIPGATR